MSTFVCLGDSQLGVATVELADQEAVWDRIVDLALEREADAVLHGGDLFEHVHVTSDVHAAFRRPLARLREANIPMLLIRGNHDGATRPVDALDVFREYPNLIVSQRPEVHTIADVNIVTLPWTSPAGMVAALNGDVSRDAINDEAARLLVKIAGNLISDEPNILLAHWSISSGSLPNGLPLEQLKEPVLEWAELEALGFDVVVASHIHQAQRLDRPDLGDSTLGFYTGSPQQLNSGEHGEHGAWVLDIAAGLMGIAVSTEFVPIPSKKFVTFDFELTDETSGMTPWSEFVQPDSIVRLRIKATEDQARRLDHADFRRALLEAGASRVQIEPQIIRENRARAEQISDSLSAEDALAAYCQAEHLEEALADRMRSTLRDWMTA